MGAIRISDALGSDLVKQYWSEQYTSKTEDYYSKGAIEGRFHGKLAEQWGIIGRVTKEEFERLADGRHPLTGEQLVQWNKRKPRITSKGKQEKEHIAGWDLCIGPHKSITAAALVGGDKRIIDLHHRACQVVMQGMRTVEEYTQARTAEWGGPQTSNLIAAAFTHTSARPVGGIPDPHLHTHFLVFNMTSDGGKIHAIQPLTWYRMQRFLDATYQAEMAAGLQELGYQLDRNTAGMYAAIGGYPKEYLLETSKRTVEIGKKMKELKLSGARASHIIAHQYREEKVDWPEEKMREYHRELSRQFGVDPDAIPAAARQAPQRQIQPEGEHAALTFAKHSLSERTAAFEQYEVFEQALRFGLGNLRLKHVAQAFEERDDFREIGHWRPSSPGKRFTTPEMLELERDVMSIAAAGRDTMEPIAPETTRDNFREKYAERLTNAQKWLAYNVLTSRDRVFGIQGRAGVGKTHAIEVIREIAEDHGHTVIGLAPTSGAVGALKEAGLANSLTIQRFVADVNMSITSRHLLIVDESSLASTPQVHRVLELCPEARVIFAGDIRQHQSVEAGRVFEELQQSGMTTYGLNKIMRQKDPDLLEAVQYASRGRPDLALEVFDKHGWVHEAEGKTPRYRGIADDFANSPGNTVVIDPCNETVNELNQELRERMRQDGCIEPNQYGTTILRNRSDLTAEQKKHSWNYQEGEVLRFAKGNKELGIRPGTYATIESIDRDANRVTLAAGDHRFTWKPNSGVQAFNEEPREFAIGDRIQFTQPWRAKRVDNRDFGDVTDLDDAGNIRVRLQKNGRQIGFNLREMRHLDYAYAVTSYAIQGASRENVLVHVAANDSRSRQMIDQIFANVAFSRAQLSCRIYCDSREEMGEAFNQLHLKPKAHSKEQIHEYRPEYIKELTA